MALPRVDIVVPVFNEKENFSVLFQNIQRCVQADWRLMVIYDRPDDTTLEVASPLSASDARIELITNASKGVLGAIKTGFNKATADAVLVLMVDDPLEIIEKIDELANAFYAENATIAVASRYMNGGSHTGGPLLKGLLSRLAGVSLYYVIGLPTHDATYATRLYRKSFLDRTTIETKEGFVFTLELTLKAYFGNEKIIELPVNWEERVVGESHFKLAKWLPMYLHWYVWGIKKRYFPFLIS